MDARDYIRIMREEGLEETQRTRELLEEAKRCQRLINKFKKEANEGESFWTDQDELIKIYLNKKTMWINEAIEMARWGRDNPELNRYYELKTRRNLK